MIYIKSIIEEYKIIWLSRFSMNSRNWESIKRTLNYNYKYNNVWEITSWSCVFISQKDFTKCKKYFWEHNIKYTLSEN